MRLGRATIIAGAGTGVVGAVLAADDMGGSEGSGGNTEECGEEG